MNDIQKAVLSAAIAELQETEYPPNSNNQKYGEWYGLNNNPWCAIFVSWVFTKSGYPLGEIDTVNGYQYCPSALAHWTKAGRITTNPQPGDIVFFDWEGDGRVDHTGIFIQDAGDKYSFFSIEGNTSLGNDSNGGEVMVRLRKYKIAKFVHPEVYG